MSDDEIRKFMEERYPQYKDNLVLGRMLYAKFVNSNVLSPSGRYIRRKISQLDGIMVNTLVEIQGLVAKVDKYVFVVCKKCGKKECGHEGREEVERVRYSILVGDETGLFTVQYFGDFLYDVGAEVVVQGRVKLFRDRFEILADNILLVEKSSSPGKGSVEEALEFVRKAKKVKDSILRNFCKSRGIDYGEVLTRVRFDNQGMVYVPDEVRK